jgi:hypothetical protein
MILKTIIAWMKTAIILIVLLLSISVAWAAAPEVVLKQGRHEVAPMPLTTNNERAVIGLERLAWPQAAEVRIEIYLSADGVKYGAEPICTLTSKGGPPVKPSVKPQTAIDCPLPGQKTAGRWLKYSVIVDGAPITTRHEVSLK